MGSPRPIRQPETAVFDGEVRRPDTPLDLEPNARYVLTIQPAPSCSENNVWDTLERLAGTVDAPPDWSSERQGPHG